MIKEIIHDHARILTITPITPKTKHFSHTKLAKDLFAELETKLGLAVVAGYLVQNGSGPYEILNLYVDRAQSRECWNARLSKETWVHDAWHDQIRDVLFDVFEKHGLTPPIEKEFDTKTGALISDTCFNISLVDLAYWQEYWKRGDDRW